MIDNLDKILGLVGLMVGIEIIAIAIFTVSVLYITKSCNCRNNRKYFKSHHDSGNYWLQSKQG